MGHFAGLFVRALLLIFLCSIGLRVLPQWSTYVASDTLSKTLRLTLTGDIMQHSEQMDAARSGTKYLYDPAFLYIAPYLQQSDFTIGNLELTLGGKPYSGYPCFSAPDTLLYALKRAGFNVLTTANNHTCDRKTKGILRTIDQIEKVQIPFTGTFRNAQERDSLTPRMLERNGIRMALLAYTYGTNGIPFAPPVIVNLIDTVQMLSDLQKASALADFTVVALHWGLEYHDEPSREQKQIAKFLFRNGVTLIVGNHPHVVQPIQLLCDSLGDIRQMAIYSMGNFISAQRTFPRAGSMLVHVVVEKSGKGIRLRAPQYLLTYVDRPVVEGKRIFRILPLEGQFLEPDSYPWRYRKHAERILAGVHDAVVAIHRRALPYRPPVLQGFPLFRLKDNAYTPIHEWVAFPFQ